MKKLALLASSKVNIHELLLHDFFIKVLDSKRREFSINCENKSMNLKYFYSIVNSKFLLIQNTNFCVSLLRLPSTICDMEVTRQDIECRTRGL